MDYSKELEQYAPAHTEAQVAKEVAKIKVAANRNENNEVYKFCYSAIDLTTLSCNDSVESVSTFARKAVEFYENIRTYPTSHRYVSTRRSSRRLVWPSRVRPCVSRALPADSPRRRLSSRSRRWKWLWPSKTAPTRSTVVMNVGKVLTGAYDEAASEVELLRNEVRDVVFKVIIESGALKSPELIRKASLLSMLAGADFVKTSTGKTDVAATPEAAFVMCHAIKDYYNATGRKVGFKTAGGVRTPSDAALYYTIVEEVLGKEWITTDLFRIGASSAANNIISAIEDKDIKYF